MVSCCLVRDEFRSVAFPDEQRLQERPGLAVSPLFAEDIGWVVSTLDVVELGDGRSDAFTDLVERQSIVSFVEACMWNGGAVHHGFVVTPNIIVLPLTETPR